MIDKRENKLFLVEIIDSLGRYVLVKEGTILKTRQPVYFKIGNVEHQISIQQGEWRKGESGFYQLNIKKLKEITQEKHIEISFREIGKNRTHNRVITFLIAYG